MFWHAGAEEEGTGKQKWVLPVGASTCGCGFVNACVACSLF